MRPLWYLNDSFRRQLDVRMPVADFSIMAIDNRIPFYGRPISSELERLKPCEQLVWP